MREGKKRVTSIDKQEQVGYVSNVLKSVKRLSETWSASFIKACFEHRAQTIFTIVG